MSTKTKAKKPILSMQVDLDQLLPASAEEKKYVVKMRKSSTYLRDGLKRLLRNKIATFSAILIILITLAVIIIPFVWPYSYEQQLGQSALSPVDATYSNLKPFEYGQTEQAKIQSGENIFPHIFGTDSAGRDYFIRCVYGARISLAVGFFASIMVLIIGFIMGAVSGFFGGRVDMVIMRIVDIFYSVPDMLIIVLLAAVIKEPLTAALNGTVFESLGSNIISMFIVFGLLYWVGMARQIRGQILSLREEEYVLASRAAGGKSLWIIFKHLLPNCIGIIIVYTALQIPAAIFTESYLSFLGLGVSAPMPSLGSLASDALNGLDSYFYRLIIPAVIISVIVLSLNLLGDGLRDAFDPKVDKD
jgi:oligopeptide transport system permease protein